MSRPSRVAIVTGANHGIGAATATALARDSITFLVSDAAGLITGNVLRLR